MQFISLTKGWKTYATVAIGISIGVAQAYGIHIPSYVDWILGFAGLGFHRAAITSQSQATTQALEALVQQVLSQVTIPQTTLLPGSVVTVGATSLRGSLESVAQTVVIGQPSNVSVDKEAEETAVLNAFQVKH